MTNNSLLARPALTALTAALALASTPALSQVADPATGEAAPPASIVVPSEQPAPTPVLPTVALPQITVAAPPATVQAPPAAAALPEVAPAMPVREARGDVAPRTEQSEPATARREARAEPASIAPRVVTPAPASEAVTPPAQPSMPILLPSDMVGSETAPTQEAAIAPAVVEPSDASQYWLIGAGGAVLLLGIGGIALLRRRDRRDDARDAALLAEPAFAQPATPPAAAMPARRTASADVSTQAPSWMPAAISQDDSHFRDLETLVAEQPSAQNPFVTRKARLRRAEFIHRTRHAPASPAVATPEAISPVAAQDASQKRPQQVYTFNTGGASLRPQGWKPATT